MKFCHFDEVGKVIFKLIAIEIIQPFSHTTFYYLTTSNVLRFFNNTSF